jgi:5-methylthioadenosine/S-adenosylhomocysteine deaminase
MVDRINSFHFFLLFFFLHLNVFVMHDIPMVHIMATLFRGGWIVVGTGNERRCIREGALLVDEGRIIDIGNYSLMKRNHDIDLEKGSKDNIILPGLVNAHYHGRGLTMLERGLTDTPLELYVSHSRPATEPYYDTLLACIRLVKSGVTCAVHNHIMYHAMQNSNEYMQNLRESMRAYIDSGLRVAFAPTIANCNQIAYQEGKFLGTLPDKVLRALHRNRNEDNSSVADIYFRTIDLLHKEYEGYDDRTAILYSPRGGQWCSDDLLERIKEQASKNTSHIHLHLLETKYQKQYAMREFGKTMVQHMADLDFWGPEVSCAHAVWATKKDIKILAEHGVTVVHNPRLFSGIAPIPEMLRAGINVGLGTDGLSINDDDDMFQEMRVCSLIHRAPGIRSRYIDSNTIIDMATVNAAKAVGPWKNIGSLEIGNRADFIILDSKPLTFSNELPFSDAILYKTKQQHIRMVVVQGQTIMENGRLTRIKEDEVISSVAQLHNNLRISKKGSPLLLKKYLQEYYGNWDKT